MTSGKGEILFRGTLPSNLKKPEFKKREGPPNWFTILEQVSQVASTEKGKLLYGDPEKGGATVEQAWRTVGLCFGLRPVCLFTTDKGPITTDAIQKVVELDSKGLVNVLSEILSLEPGVQVLYYDGQSGHSITLIEYDAKASRFTYHDPWPNFSLLCKEYNAAGVDALPVEEEKGNWSITSAELEKVIVAAFVEQYLWATHNHEKYFLTYEEFKNTDFWSFFHITEKERSLEENNFTTIELRTKAFRSEVKLCVTLDVQQRVIEAGLGLKRKWLIGPPFGLNPFALDIARSFIAMFIPPPEQQQMKELITKFSDIRKPNYAQQVLLEKTDEALLTYLGAAPTFFLMSDFSSISIENFILETEPWLRIKINISIPIYLTTSKPLRVDRRGLT